MSADVLRVFGLPSDAKPEAVAKRVAHLAGWREPRSERAVDVLARLVRGFTFSLAPLRQPMDGALVAHDAMPYALNGLTADERAELAQELGVENPIRALEVFAATEVAPRLGQAALIDYYPKSLPRELPPWDRPVDQ